MRSQWQSARWVKRRRLCTELSGSRCEHICNLANLIVPAGLMMHVFQAQFLKILCTAVLRYLFCAMACLHRKHFFIPDLSLIMPLNYVGVQRAHQTAIWTSIASALGKLVMGLGPHGLWLCMEDKLIWSRHRHVSFTRNIRSFAALFKAFMMGPYVDVASAWIILYHVGGHPWAKHLKRELVYPHSIRARDACMLTPERGFCDWKTLAALSQVASFRPGHYAGVSPHRTGTPLLVKMILSI